MIQKSEAEEHRPSKAIAEHLADVLEIGAGERAAFVRWARGRVSTDVLAGPRVPVPTPDADSQLPGNLPLERTSLVAREHERTAAHTLLATNRLVTLTGGTGTRTLTCSLCWLGCTSGLVFEADVRWS